MSGVKPPQQLSRQAIDEFKVIYEQEFNERLSDDEVEGVALRFLRFFAILNQLPPARPP